MTNLNKEVIQWAYHYLSSHGYILKNVIPEIIQNTPWSYVARFVTSTGFVYLKHTPPLLALEANIIKILQDHFHAPVPRIISNNNELNCFLMKDAGKSLRSILKQKFDIELLCKGIYQFTSLQLAVAERIDVLLDIGVPDWRLDKFPDLYEQLLSQKKILIKDGLSETEISELEKLLPNVFNLCKKLSDYSIKQTIVQPDFNDNNILIDENTQKITIIDLGEIVISHPFFSLINCLNVIKKHYALEDNDDVYLHIMDAYFKNYIVFDSKNRLLEAFSTARVLWFIYEALAHYRLRVACDQVKFMQFQNQGRLCHRLKEFMIECNANNCDGKRV